MQEGTYSDTIENSVLCDSIITINLQILKSYAQIDTVVCDSFVSPSGKYVWTQEGTYSDTIENSALCDSIITIKLSFIKLDTSITQTDSTLISNAEGVHYQWINCETQEIISDANNKIFRPTKNGGYAVIISDRNCIDTSSCYYMKIKNEEIPEINFILSPNGDGINDYWIYSKNLPKQTYIRIYNANGVLLGGFYSEQFPNGWDGTLEGKPLPSGNYWFISQTPNGIIEKGLIVIVR